jgi:hypothetical protein
MTAVIRSDMFCPERELRFAQKRRKEVVPVMVWRQGFVLTTLMDGAAG